MNRKEYVSEQDNISFISERMNWPEDLKSVYESNNQRMIIDSTEQLPFEPNCLESNLHPNYSDISTFNKTELKDKNIKKIIAWHLVSIIEFPPNQTKYFDS